MWSCLIQNLVKKYGTKNNTEVTLEISWNISGEWWK